MLSKTQHHYYQIRESSLQNVIGLVLDDYLKLRGSILIYVIAALVDDHNGISELAYEVLIKHTLEKSDILLRTCLLECPFVLNGYMYMENLDVFTDTELSLESPVIGDKHLNDRQYIYRVFIHNIDTIHCYLYFQNFHMILDKLEKEKLIRTPEGLAAVYDFLYILGEICRSKEKTKKKLTDTGMDNEDEGIAMNEQAAVALPSTSSTTSRKKGPTIEQALIAVEKIIPRIAEMSEQLLLINANKFHNIIDELCIAMCEHFEDLTELAQPQAFWNKYRNRKKNIRFDDSDDYDDDNDGGKQKKIIKKKRSSGRKNELDSESECSDTDNISVSPKMKPPQDTIIQKTKRTARYVPATVEKSQSEDESDLERKQTRLIRKRVQQDV